MDNKRVKVVVDYTNGYCNLIGMVDGKIRHMKKPIRGVDRDGYEKASYSRRLIRLRRIEIKNDIEKIIASDPEFRYSKKMIKKVDPLIYKALEDWDLQYETTYALDYLKAMIQEFPKDRIYYDAREQYEEICATDRDTDLYNAGLDISYNVGIFNTIGGLTLFDKIRGMRMARTQNKLCRANVHSSLILKKDYYLEDIEAFVSDENNFKIEGETGDGTTDPFEHDEEFLTDEEREFLESERVRQYKREQAIRMAKEDEMIRQQIAEQVQEIMANKSEEENRRKEEAARAEAEVKALIKQREEEEKRQAEEEARKLEEERRQAEEEARRLEEEKRQAEEEARKLEEEQRKAEEKAKAERQAKIEKITNNKVVRRTKAEVRHWKRKIRDVKDSIKNKKFVPRFGKNGKKIVIIEKITNNKVARRAKAEVRHWKRKIRDAKDSIRNKKFVPRLGENGKKIVIKGVAVGLAVLLAWGVSKTYTGSRDKGTIVDAPGITISAENPETTESPVIDDVITDETTQEAPEESEGSSGGTVQEVPEKTEENSGGAVQEAPEGSEGSSGGAVQEAPEESEENANGSGQASHDKTDEEKIAEFRELAEKRYKDALIIGETPLIGDVLIDQTFSQNPDGTGNKGYFSEDSAYAISHINLITASEGWKTIRAEGKSLTELLAEYPDCSTYSIHFVNPETGGWLGFVTKDQYEQLIQNKINQIIESRTADKGIDLNEDDLMR